MLEPDFPMTCRSLYRPLATLLAKTSNQQLPMTDTLSLTREINWVADSAKDVDEIVCRLLNPDTPPEEISPLLAELSMTIEKLHRLCSDIDVEEIHRWSECINEINNPESN